MVKVSRHVHEVQSHRQETQVPKNLRKKPCGPGTTGPGRHGKVRKQEQRLPLDTDSCRDFEPVCIYDTHLQKGHQGRSNFCWKVLKEGSVNTRTSSSLTKEKSFTTSASGIF